jgi:hypothetical protein
MAINRLGLYNVALGALGERPLSSLTEEGEPRLLLDDVWSRNNGVIQYALEQGHWNFAMRSQAIDADTSVTPSFGFEYAFVIPSDRMKLNMISGDEYFNLPLVDYEEEAGYWFADVDPLYVRFVSNDTSGYGGDLSMWPETFARWVGHYMACEIAMRIVGDEKKLRDLEVRTKRLLLEARSHDAAQEPTRFAPYGTWVHARRGRFSKSLERGKRNTLIG